VPFKIIEVPAHIDEEGETVAPITGNAITVEQFEQEANSEYLRFPFWSRFMGRGENAPIQLKDDLTKSRGDAITINLRSQLKGGVQTGSEKSEGQEGNVEFYGQRITVDNDKITARMDDVEMVQQRVKFSVYQSLRDAIVEKRALRTEDRITNEMSDTATGRVQGNYLYGALDSNYNATHATALATVDNTDDQLTTTIGDLCRDKARVPANSKTMKTRPMRVNMGMEGGVQEWYGFVNHIYSVNDLVRNDARWRQPMLMIPPMVNKNSPLFTGSNFKGAYNGVLYYEWEGVELADNSNSVQTGHGLFFGAQACAFVWAQFGKFTEDVFDYENDVGLQHKEINGVAKIIYDVNAIDSTVTNSDYGIIHAFTAATAAA